MNTFQVPSRAIVLDTETTGFTPKHGHRIVELAAIELCDGVPTGRAFHEYLDPKRPVDPQAAAVHGLTNRFLAGKPTFEDVVDDFLAFLAGTEDPVYAHNASFDQRFVDAELEWAGRAAIGRMTCSLKLARRHLPGDNHKLETLAAQIDHDWSGRGPHSALSDCDALGAVLVQRIWPAMAQAPDDPKPARAPAKPRAAARPAPSFSLPEGFTPIAAETDDRIRRYDVAPLEDFITARGKRWTPDEERNLAIAFLDGNPIEDMVRDHGRTPAALLLKLEGLGVIADDHPYVRR